MFPGLLRGGLALALTLTCVVTSMAARREEPSFRGIQLSDEVVKTNLSHMFKTIAQIESENKITIRGFNKENITNALVNYTDSIKQIESEYFTFQSSAFCVWMMHLHFVCGRSVWV